MGTILVTGATGTVGLPLVKRLLLGGERVRCFVRDPRRLGPLRVRVGITLGDLSDRRSMRNAVRDVDTVIHLAAAIRDQPVGSIEALNGLATLGLIDASAQAGVRRFVYFSALSASEHSPAPLMRAKALAERAVTRAPFESIVFAPSIVYAPGDPWLGLIERMAALPAVPLSGSGRARFQPIWAEDVADCVVAALQGAGDRRFELAGPEVLSEAEIVRLVVRAARHGRTRPVVRTPRFIARRFLHAVERVAGASAFATWDEAELMEISMTTARGTTDAEALGVVPLTMAQVLNID